MYLIRHCLQNYKLKTIKLGINLLLVVTLISCDPVWVPDPVNPDLPKYTENGLNVAGALVNGERWEAKLDCDYGFLFDETICRNDLEFQSNDDGSLSVYLDGDMPDGRTLEFHFTLANQSQSYLADKESLHNKKFSIDGIVNTIRVKDSGNPCIQNSAGHGQLYFRRVQQRKGATIIDFSGTFGFVIGDVNGCGQYEVFYGRFDYSHSL